MLSKIIKYLPLAGLFGVLLLAGSAALAQGLDPLCFVETPEGVSADCGTVTVIEDRSTGTGTIAIGVMRYHSEHPEAVPVFLLAGGPGESGIQAFTREYEALIAPLLTERDVVVFDQRGVGVSGRLVCPNGFGEGGVRFDTAFPGPQFAEFYAETIAECGQQLAAEGVNLAAYTSAASAADIADLAAALGYEQINLYGWSYGTRLAQAVMRDFPALVNAVVLDSTMPVAINPEADAPAAFDEALQTLFAACAADSTCAEAYPDLPAAFESAHAALREQDLLIDGIDPLTGDPFPLAVNNNVFTGIIFNGFYTPMTIRLLPGAIAGAAAGDFTLLGQVAGYTLSPSSNMVEMLADGMQYAVTCGEETVFETREDILAAMAEYPLLNYPLYTGHQLGDKIIDACATWPVGEPDTVINQPVESDIPTLILSGAFDMITPTSWTEALAEPLSQSYVYIFPTLAHVTATADACPLGIVQDFLRDPLTAPAGDCIDAMSEITFEIVALDATASTAASDDAAPEESASGEPGGAQFLIPEDWVAGEEGTYVSPDGLASLTQQVIPAPSPAFVLPVVASQIGLSELGEGSELTTGDLTWTVYSETVNGVAFEIAAAADTQVYLILLAAPTDQRDELYESVFLPALEGFTPGE